MKAISSNQISKLFHLPYSEEFEDQIVNPTLEESVYIGKTKESSLHFFLDFETVFNPHVFVFGMSGGGKSYLLKSLLARLHAVTSSSLIMIDFTGEYLEFATQLECAELNLLGNANKFSPFSEKLSYLNLSQMEEAEKVQVASMVLENLLAQMRKRGASQGARLFVFLDEAWKLLLKGDVVDTLIREGRKYGVGMILASQILGDIKESFLSNVATIFCFRIQDGSSLDRLERSYLLGGDELSKIQNLDVGSCLAIRIHKDKQISHFFIGKVSGVLLPKIIPIIVRDMMRFEIPEGKFEQFLSSLLLSQEARSKIKQLFSGNYSVELQGVISGLLNEGASARAILEGLRLLKIDDASIADAFSKATLNGANK